MKNKINLYEATLVSFDRISKKTYNETREQVLSTVLEFTNIRTITCVIDEKRGNAIDIETGDVHHIIQRDLHNNILPKEVNAIKNSKSGELFVFKYYEKNLNNISLIYQMYIYSRGQKKYKEYLESIKTKENGPVKKLSKPKTGYKLGK